MGKPIKANINITKLNEMFNKCGFTDKQGNKCVNIVIWQGNYNEDWGTDMSIQPDFKREFQDEDRPYVGNGRTPEAQERYWNNRNNGGGQQSAPQANQSTQGEHAAQDSDGPEW